MCIRDRCISLSGCFLISDSTPELKACPPVTTDSSLAMSYCENGYNAITCRTSMYRYDDSEGIPKPGRRTHVSGISIYAFTDGYDDFFQFACFLHINQY